MRARWAAALLLALACSHGARHVTPPTTPPPTSPPATTAPPTTPAPPAVVAGALAYVTNDAVRLRDADGTVRTIGEIPQDDRMLDLAWSGRYIGWLTMRPDGTRVLAVHDLASHRTGSTPANGSDNGFDALGVTSRGFVVVGGDRTMSFVEPAAVVEGGDHTVVAIAGLHGRTRLLTANATRILVAEERVRPEVAYDVDLRGRATRLFAGDVVAAGFTAGNGRLVYATRITGDEECTLDYTLAVRDVATGRTTSGGPTLRDDFYVAESVATGPDGRTYVAMTNEVGGCSPVHEVHRLYRLDGDRWRLVDGDARWGAGSPGAGLAVIRASGDLVVRGRVVARQVTLAAWAPRDG